MDRNKQVKKTRKQDRQKRFYAKKTNSLQNIIISTIIGIIFLSLSIGILIKGKIYQRQYDTIAHQSLDLEKESGFEVRDSQYQVLDRLISQIIDKLSAHYGIKSFKQQKGSYVLKGTPYNEKDAEVILSIIDQTLTENNYLHRNSHLLSNTLTGTKLDNDLKQIIRDKGHLILSRDHAKQIDISDYVNNPEREVALKTFLKENSDKVTHISKHLNEIFHYTDCHNTTTIYLAVGEILQLPLFAVNIPNHSFLRWKINENEYIDWEETRGKRSNEYSYSQLSGVSLSDPVVKNGVYFKSLSSEKTLFIRHVIIGNILIQKGMISRYRQEITTYYKRAITHFEKALRYNPQFLVAHNNIGMAYERLGDISHKFQARQYYNITLEEYQKAYEAYPGNSNFLKQKQSVIVKIKVLSI